MKRPRRAAASSSSEPPPDSERGNGDDELSALGAVLPAARDGAGGAALMAASLLLVPAAQAWLAPAGTPLLPLPPFTLTRGVPPAVWRSFALLGLAPLAAFCLCAAAWALVDAAVAAGAAPPALARAKLQPWQPSARAYGRAAAVAARSWLCVGLPWAWLLASAVGPRLGLAASAAAAWPGPAELLWHAPAFLLLVELGFYASHRALHALRAGYALVHRQHHEFSAPFALAAVYAHPLEHLLSNVLPISLGPLLMRSHPMTAAIWACIAVFATCGAHSGYYIPGLTRAPFHDWHHEVYVENFGVLGAVFGLDRWLGTSTRFRAKWAAAA